MVSVSTTTPPPTVPWNAIIPPASDGWSLLTRKTLASAPAGAQVVVEYNDSWDVNAWNLFEIGSLDGHMRDIQNQYRASGSDLYAYAVYEKTDFNFLGVSVKTYRIILFHSLVWLAWFAIIAAVYLLVSLASGVSPITALQNLPKWVCSFFGDACHPSAANRNTYLWLLGAGIVASFGVWAVSNEISKREFGEGVAPPGAPPITTPGFSSESTSGFSAGPISTRSGSGITQAPASGPSTTGFRKPVAGPPHAEAASRDRAARRSAPATPAHHAGFQRQRRWRSNRSTAH